MADHSAIEWTDATWNPVAGCRKVSPGCENCYAIRFAHRMARNPNPKISAVNAGLTQITNGKPNWTGLVRTVPERLDQPLRWREPRRVFVNSQSDLFHEDVPEEFIVSVWAVMLLACFHTFQILTKRPERMRAIVGAEGFHGAVLEAAAAEHPSWMTPRELAQGTALGLHSWPLANVWLGTSVEDQRRAGERIPHLIETPAAVLFLSCEPLLGPVDLDQPKSEFTDVWTGRKWLSNLDWVIVGGESGAGARPMAAEWARSLRDQCQAAAVPFFFKQWGAWGLSPGAEGSFDLGNGATVQVEGMARVGKKATGRLLDGREWSEFPAVAP